MTAYVALIRAVNVGGRQLKMADLMRIAGELRLGSPQTYIASGNLVFTSNKSERALKSALEEGARRPLGCRRSMSLSVPRERWPAR